MSTPLLVTPASQIPHLYGRARAGATEPKPLTVQVEKLRPVPVPVEGA